MNIEQMLSMLDENIVERLKTAVEIGKWPNGVALTAEQRQTCLQAVIAWEHQHVDPTQRTGYIEKPKKEEDSCSSHDHTHEEVQPIRFV